MRQSAGNQEQNVHDSVLLWFLREVVRDVGSTEGFLVCAVHKVPERINIGTEWSMFNADVIGMSALKSNKNASNVLGFKSIGLLLSSFIIAKIDRLNQVSGSGIFPGAKLSVVRKPTIARDLSASRMTWASGIKKQIVLFLLRRLAGTSATLI